MATSSQHKACPLATGRTTSVREFCRMAFAHVGLDWEAYVKTDSTFLRPAEVEVLMGDAGKAQRKLGWTATTSLEEMVAEMVEADLARHKALEDEVRTLRSLIKTTEKSRDELVAQARLKISADQARQVIVARLRRLLLDSYRQYLRADQRACVAAIENLWRKYAVTARQIEAERDAAAKELQAFLVELGYE